MASACGETANAHLLVQLRALNSEDPFAGVSSLRVSLKRDGNKVLKSKEFAHDGTPIEMPAIDRQEATVIEIVGLPADETQPPVSRAEDVLPVPQRGKSCCVILCFCRTETFEQQGCGCGEPQCVSSCTL
jgi:hypothetical protein